MPRIKSHWLLEIARDLRAFLNLEAGLVRGAVPEPGVAETTERDGQLERLQKQLENREQRIKQLGKALSRERQTVVAPQPPSGDDASADASARAYVLENYGRQNGLQSLDLLDVLPGFNETVSVNDQAGDGALPFDVAFVKSLARGREGCKYLEVGPARGESAANVAAVAGECVSVDLSGAHSDSVPGGPGPLEGLIAERTHRKDGAKDVSYTSFVFDGADFEGHFDLASIDGRGSRERAELATRSVFGFLKDAGTVVWRGYRRGPGEVDWRVLAGILDGCPEGRTQDLRHVSGTSCAVYMPGLSARRQANVRRNPGRSFDLTLTARDVPRKLVVLDDTFPNLQSAFRIAEYNAYLERWGDATVYSTAQKRVSLRQERGFGQVLDEYAGVYPGLASRVFRFGGEVDLKGDLAYFIFLGNAARFIHTIDANDTPFAFTLYPGGGFKIDQQDSDEVLRRTCSSPNFKKVIATQRITREYLVDGGFCDPEKIEFVYGGVFPLAALASQAPPKRFYKHDKDTFDVCFVAYKYNKRSIISKGYDVFVEVAKILSKTHEDVRFHVVGTFDESDVDVGEIGEKIIFYGPRTSGFFPEFYSRMDAILSPNVPFTLLPGAFDGFPTGSCMEAGLCGVAVLCADPLGLNVAFGDGEEMVVIPNDAGAISDILDGYRDRPEEMYRLARRGQESFARVFGMEAQMGPRLRVLSELLGEDGVTPEG